MDITNTGNTPSSTSAMYQIEDDEESSTTTEDNEDVETVKTAADIGKISIKIHVCIPTALRAWPIVII